MKIRGGYTPRIAGRPSSIVQEVALPESLHIDLQCANHQYTPTVQTGDDIAFGDPIAETPVDGGTLYLPAPASGKAAIEQDPAGKPVIRIRVTDNSTTTDRFEKYRPDRATAETVRSALARAGLWPMFWSSHTHGTPSLRNDERPRAIVVNCVAAEPFRARGKTVLQQDWAQIVEGLKFLPRLLTDYGTIHVVLTHTSDPVARMMHLDLAGYAWVRFQSVPLVYPVEDPQILTRAVRRQTSLAKEDTIWMLDIHAVNAVGACLSHGIPLHKRLVALGGPGARNPRHVSARIGTPLPAFIAKQVQNEATLLLRGGIMKGHITDCATGAVRYDDDAFFLLPRQQEREFLSFVRPGFDRCSLLPAFATTVTRRYDRHISNALRGERRPCIACGLCEKVCPVHLMPQILHRYLYREAYDQAEACGLNLCAGCGLCTFVCPSKIELQRQFDEARAQLECERKEAEASAARAAQREEQKRIEDERSEDWRQ